MHFYNQPPHSIQPSTLNSKYSQSNSFTTTRHLPPQSFTTSNVSQSPSIFTPSLKQSLASVSRSISPLARNFCSPIARQGSIVIAPPIINKAVINPPEKSVKIQYVPYQTKEIVYDKIEKSQMVPVHKTTTQYQTIKHQELIPIQKAVTDFIAIEHITNYKPITFENKVLDYIQQEVVEEKVNYKVMDSKRILPKDTAAMLSSKDKLAGSTTSVNNMLQSSYTIPNIPLTTSTYDIGMLGSRMTLLTSMVSHPRRSEIDLSVTKPMP